MIQILHKAWALVIAAALVITPAAAFAKAVDWNVDRNASAIRFSGTHAGNAFKGSFGQWTARIRFDAKDLKASRFIVVIDTASATTGDKVQETTLVNPEWFDSATHKFATFRSTSISARGGNRYAAQGMLEIKGKATPVTLPFTVDISGNKAKANGSLTLDRMALDMGTKSDPKGDFVSRNIDLAISVSATKA